MSLPVFESNFWTALLRANQTLRSGPIEKLPSPGVLSGSSPAMSGVMVKFPVAGSSRTRLCAQFSEAQTMSFLST